MSATGSSQPAPIAFGVPEELDEAAIAERAIDEAIALAERKRLNAADVAGLDRAGGCLPACRLWASRYWLGLERTRDDGPTQRGVAGVLQPSRP
jgi:hypothetical protein